MNDVPECGIAWYLDGRLWILVGLILAGVTWGAIRVMR